MKKTQVYLPEEDLAELHRVAERTGRSVAALLRRHRIRAAFAFDHHFAQAGFRMIG